MQSPGRTQQHFSRSKNTLYRIEEAFMYVELKIHSYVSCLFHKLRFAELTSR